MKQHTIVADRYLVLSKIGSGSFGEVHVGVDLKTREQVAIKFECKKANPPRLYFESIMYNYLQEGRCYGIPSMRCFDSTTHKNCNALVMDLLGQSLEDLFVLCGRRFSLKTVLMLAHQMLNVVEYVHSKSFIHRDIKPEIFLMCLGRQASQVFMIDFGLAQRYRDKHIENQVNCKALIGTPRYASINAHSGLVQTRRDDLESLGYVLMYFLRGNLPWEGMRTTTKTLEFNCIRSTKANTSIEFLCQGCPSELKSYFYHCHRLRSDDAPDYKYLKRMLHNLFVREGYKYDYVFDWNLSRCPQNELPKVPQYKHTQNTTVSGDTKGGHSRASSSAVRIDKYTVKESTFDKAKRWIKEYCS